MIVVRDDTCDQTRLKKYYHLHIPMAIIIPYTVDTTIIHRQCMKLWQYMELEFVKIIKEFNL